MSHTRGEHSSELNATPASVSALSEPSSGSTLTMSTYEVPFSDALECDSPVLLPSTIYHDAVTEQGLQVKLPPKDQLRADKFSDREANTSSIWNRRRQSLATSWQTVNDGDVHGKYDDAVPAKRNDMKSLLGSPFQYVPLGSRGTLRQATEEQGQSKLHAVLSKLSNSIMAHDTKQPAQKSTAELQQEMQADLARLQIGTAQHAQAQQATMPVGGSFRRMSQRYGQVLNRSAPVKEASVIIYEVPQQHRCAVRDILQNYIYMPVPTPYFIVLTDASFKAEKLSAGQLNDSGLISQHTGLMRFVPRFSGALMTVLTYDRHGSNVSEKGAEKASRMLKPLQLSHVLQRKMFDGVSILVPDSYSPWTQLDVLATHNPPLIERITRPLVEGETVSPTDFLTSPTLPQPLLPGVVRVLVYEAQISAARHSHGPSVRKQHDKEHCHVYNGWLALLEACLQGTSQDEPPIEQLRKKSRLSDLQLLHDEQYAICQAEQSQFESFVQRRLDGSNKR